MKSESNRWQSWHQDLASVIEKNYQTDAMSALLLALEKLTDATSGLITTYQTGLKPQISHQRLLANESDQLQIDAYANGAYLLDPFYRAAMDQHRLGVVSLKDVVPHGFEQSEYFRVFYCQLNIQDEICLLMQPCSDVTISLSLARLNGKPNFSAVELSRLESVYPVIYALVKTWFLSTQQPQSTQLDWQLDEALKLFGTSILTERESQILQLSLKGYSIRFIAEKLNNSQETVKYHRKNLYRKLDINSQTELFNLFKIGRAHV